MATLSCPTSPGPVKPSSHIQPLHSLLQLSFMSTDCSHEGKIGKGSKVSEFDEWNRISSLPFWLLFDFVLIWCARLAHFHRFPLLHKESTAATTLEQSDLLIKVSASNPPVTPSYSLHFVSSPTSKALAPLLRSSRILFLCLVLVICFLEPISFPCGLLCACLIWLRAARVLVGALRVCNGTVDVTCMESKALQPKSGGSTEC